MYYKFLFRNPITYSERHCNVVPRYVFIVIENATGVGIRYEETVLRRFITDQIKTTYFQVIFFRVFVFSRNELIPDRSILERERETDIKYLTQPRLSSYSGERRFNQNLDEFGWIGGGGRERRR